MNANIFERANQIIQTCDAAYLGVIDEDGYPSVSTASPIKPEYDPQLLSEPLLTSANECVRMDVQKQEGGNRDGKTG